MKIIIIGNIYQINFITFIIVLCFFLIYSAEIWVRLIHQWVLYAVRYGNIYSRLFTTRTRAHTHTHTCGIIFTNPSARAGYDTRLIFKRSLTGLSSQAEEPSLPYYLPIAGGRIIRFIPFPRVLVLCEMQSVSSRIWTRVAYDDNHYTTGTRGIMLSLAYQLLYCAIYVVLYII